MKAGLDQMSAWLLAVALAGAVFASGYGIIRLAERGKHHAVDPHDSHAEGGGTDHEGGHGEAPSDAHGSEAKQGAKQEEHPAVKHAPSHDAGAGHGNGHEDSPADGHAAPSGHSEEHGAKEDAGGSQDHSAKAHGVDHDRAKVPSGAKEDLLAADQPASNVKWGYEGALAPAYWADLSPAFSQCRKGRAQSPIDIDETGANPKLLPIRFFYHDSPLALRHTGLAVEGDMPAGNYVEVDGERYNLLSLRFKTPSEHKVAGAPYDMELQLLHANAEGHQLYISAFYEEGAPHRPLNALWAHLPEEVGRDGDPVSLNPETLLPSRRVYFRYTGSLTTPPCTENVKWYVLAQASDVSSKQVDQLSRLILRNVRPTVPLNGRKVLRSTR